jgi:thiol-disulfide isomerase/thioredoxin
MARKAIFRAGGLAGLLAIAIVVAVVVARQPARPPFVASYFFDERRFAAIRPGMTADEVRDRVGPALWQSRPVGRDERIWTYSSMPQPVAEWTEFEVRFDGGGRVLSSRHGTVRQEKDPKTGRYPLAGATPPRPPGTLSAWPLRMIRGEPPHLGAGGERVLVQVMASWCGPCTRQRPAIEAMLARTGGSRPIKLVLVSIDEDEKALLKYLDEHHIEHPVAWDPRQSFPGFVRDKGIPRYSLLQEGMICWFDLEHTDEGDALADLEWFIRYPDFAKHLETAPSGAGG